MSERIRLLRFAEIYDHCQWIIMDLDKAMTAQNDVVLLKVPVAQPTVATQC